MKKYTRQSKIKETCNKRKHTSISSQKINCGSGNSTNFSNQYSKAVVTTTIRLRIDRRSTPIRLQLDRAMTILQGAPIKTIPYKKILYLRNCSRFFHQIYAIYRGGFRLCIQQIAFKYLVWFQNYN